MRTCTACMMEKGLEYFGVDRRSGKPMPRCKPCRTDEARAWRYSRPGYEKARYQAVKVETRERHLKRKYGVSLADYDRMLVKQDGCCAICRAAEAEQFNAVFHVDHDHSIGAVRGLLCRGCNHMLGVVADDPAILERAIAYLGVPQVAAEVIAAFMDTQHPPKLDEGGK